MDGEKKYSLLLVDDMAFNIRVLSHILKPDYNIHVATNGWDAIVAAVEKQPDIILLDVVMPAMNGYEVITILKRDARTRHIPVIFITGLNSDKDEERALQLQAADFISKPFAPGIVKLRVRNQIQIVSQLRAIEELSMTDQLTRVPNRRSFDNRLSMEWNRAIREKIPLSMLMLDIDHFKLYNDTFGHQQGDVALRTVAQTMANILRRATDFYARWGGEEFSVILAGMEHEDAKATAERIRQEVAETEIPGTDGFGDHVTVSIGVHTHVPVVGSGIADFIAGADAAVYAAKQAGRNCVRSSFSEEDK